MKIQPGDKIVVGNVLSHVRAGNVICDIRFLNVLENVPYLIMLAGTMPHRYKVIGNIEKGIGEIEFIDVPNSKKIDFKKGVILHRKGTSLRFGFYSTTNKFIRCAGPDSVSHLSIDTVASLCYVFGLRAVDIHEDQDEEIFRIKQV
jgi:hypothetical protein